MAKHFVEGLTPSRRRKRKSAYSAANAFATSLYAAETMLPSAQLNAGRSGAASVIKMLGQPKDLVTLCLGVGKPLSKLP